MLYRGVNKEADEANGGRLLPKGNIVEVVPFIDGKWTLDGTFLLGSCESNTARSHQIESGLYGGCGISTSRSEKIAIRFATQRYTVEGYVYIIDEALLASTNVVSYEFSDPLYPEEKEVTLVMKIGGAFPDQLIVEKYAVNSKGERCVGWDEQHESQL